MIGHDGDHIAEVDDLSHPLDRPGFLLVQPGDLAAQYRARRDRGDRHARKPDVEPESCRAR